MSKLTPFALFIRQALLYPLASPFLPPPNKVEKNFSYAAGEKVGTLEAGAQKNYPAQQEFVDNGDGTISDLSTGLMWAKDGQGAGCGNGEVFEFYDAESYAAGLNFAGHTGWRLPTWKELQTIVEPLYSFPSIDTDFFINTAYMNYWTSTVYVFSSGSFWVIEFSDGWPTTNGDFAENFIRLVRDI